MRKIGTLLSISLVAMFLAACAPAGNTANSNANTNANAAKPTAAAPTVDALLAQDQKANEAYIAGDSKHFEGMLSDKFVMYFNGQRVDKAATVKEIAGVKCEVKEGWKLDDAQMAKIDNDTYVVSYKSNMEGTCTSNGKKEPIPSPIRAATVWVRNGDNWQAVYHGETPIIDPKAPPPPPAKAETRKEEPNKPDTAAKTDDKAAGNTNAASNAAASESAPAKAAPSANTDALTKVHLSGWEAWKAKDGKTLSDISSANLAIVDPMGNWHGTKDGIMKAWTEMKCEGITKVSFTDTVATAISPTVEILTGKGMADGSCDGQKNGVLYQTAVYVKEGDSWKLAFMFESPGMPA